MFKNLAYKIFSLPRIYKLFTIIFLDIFLIFLSCYTALAIRLDEINLFEINDKILISFEYFLIPVFSYLIFAVIFKFYSFSFRYYNLGNDIFYVYPLIAIIIILLNKLFNEYFSYGAVIINIILIFSSIILSRKFISKIYLLFHNKSKIISLIICSSKNLHKIYEHLNLDDKILVKSVILEDYKKIDFTRYRNLKLDHIENLNKICEKHKIKNIFTDKLHESLKGKINKKIKIEILQIEDLFRHFEVDIKQQFVDKYFNTSDKIKIKSLNYYNNSTILITGAGGSIGKQLFFELLNSRPKKIILVEQDEWKLFKIKKEYENIKLDKKKKHNIIFKLGNLSNETFLKKIFLDDKKIDYVLHAAAYKHVGFGEENIFSFIRNNVLVTYNLANISIKKKVKKFIFISTDKAVNPQSVMGYSKSMCEKILIYLNNRHKLKNIFKIVRFGNVINSDGSVLPIFESQILKGGPVTVTNKDVTRYFMSIKNACQLVLNTIEIDKKIGIFILDMGKPYKILDIANSMIDFYLNKKKITKKPKIIFIGLQKGEKIHEELLLGKNLTKTKKKNILSANEIIEFKINYLMLIKKFKKSITNNNINKALHLLSKYA